MTKLVAIRTIEHAARRALTRVPGKAIGKDFPSPSLPQPPARRLFQTLAYSWNSPLFGTGVLENRRKYPHVARNGR